MSDLFDRDSRDDLLRKLRAVLTEQYEIECILADALGYERGEEGGPCSGSPVIGDHTAVTLAMQAARALEAAASALPDWIHVGGRKKTDPIG